MAGSDQGSWIEDNTPEQKRPQAKVTYFFTFQCCDPARYLVSKTPASCHRFLSNCLWPQSNCRKGWRPRHIRQEAGQKWIPWDTCGGVLRFTEETGQEGREDKGEVTPRTSPEPCLLTFVKSLSLTLKPQNCVCSNADSMKALDQAPQH